MSPSLDAVIRRGRGTTAWWPRRTSRGRASRWRCCERRDDRGRRVRDRGAVARRARLARRVHAVAAAAGDHRDLELARHGLEVARARAVPLRPLPRRPQGRHVVDPRAHARAARAPTGRGATRTAYDAFAERWEARRGARPAAAARAARDRERWLDAVGPGILDGPIADELAASPPRRCACPSRSRG